MDLASIPSPTVSVWHLGSVPIRAYALIIIVGIIAAAVVCERRMRSRGAAPNAVLDIAIFAVPAGIIGARLYNVATSWQDYFGKNGAGWVATLEVWHGGLGIWGAVIGGALGAWWACRVYGLPLTFVADCLAPGLPLAQGIGRLGNYFNNELYGKQTTLPWGLRVHSMGADGHAVSTLPGLYQPTFLYELIWDVLVALLVLIVDRKVKFGKGRAFALYVMAYTVGRAWIEYLRIDEANHILGLRLNDWTCLIVFVAALIYFLRAKGPREFLVPVEPRGYRVVTEAEFTAFKAGGVSGTEAATGDDVSPDGEGAASLAAGADEPGTPDGAGPPADGQAEGDPTTSHSSAK